MFHPIQIIIRQFVTFTCVGAVGTIAHYVTLVLLVRIASFDPILASGIGFVIGAVINYFLNYRYTFHSSVPHRKGLTMFFTVAAVGIGFNTLAIGVLIRWFSVHYLLAQLCATGVVLLWNFVGNRFWTFRGSGYEAKH